MHYSWVCTIGRSRPLHAELDKGRSAILLACGPCRASKNTPAFAFVWTHTCKDLASPENIIDWYDFLTPAFTSLTCSCYWIDSVRVKAESCSEEFGARDALFEDPLKENPWTSYGPLTCNIKCMNSPPSWKARSIAMTFRVRRPSAHKCSASPVSNCHGKRRKRRPTLPYSLHGKNDNVPTTPFRKTRIESRISTRKSIAETWYARLVDNNPCGAVSLIEVSKSFKKKKKTAKTAKFLIDCQFHEGKVLQGRLLTRRTLLERCHINALQALQIRHDPASIVSWASMSVAQDNFL